MAGTSRPQPVPQATRDRAEHWRGRGLSEQQVRHELIREDHDVADAQRAARGEYGDPEPEQQQQQSGQASQRSTPRSAPPRSGKRSGKRSGGGRASRSSSSWSIPVGSGSVPAPGTAGGVLLAVLLYPAALAAIQRGPAGVKRWFKAKFLNQTGASGSAQSAAWMQPAESQVNAINAVLSQGSSPGGSGVVTTGYGISSATPSGGVEATAWGGVEKYRPGKEPTLIAFGKQLQAEGWTVIEHPAFGGVHPVHAPGVSLHYKPGNGRGNAIDVSRPGMVGADALVGRANAVGLGAKWRCIGHYDHVHIDTSLYNRVNGETLTPIPGVRTA